MLMGIIDLPWWGYVVTALVFTHITIASVTIYLHRHSAHRALDLHPMISHFFRFWLWLTTGMVTKEWTAIHRKHHARVETEEDPHSPIMVGIKKVLLEGAELYRAESKKPETMEKYGAGTPDDWLERNLYSRFSWQGVALMLIINLILFGPLGLTIWAVQMLWIPFFAAGIINGVGHYWGYRNYACEDASSNIVPWGILIGGEELHNNHHAYGTSAKFSAKWYEFDIGWAYIRTLEMLKLAKVRRVAPKLKMESGKLTPDLETLQAVITHRYAVLTNYARTLKATYRTELSSLKERSKGALDGESLQRLKAWLHSDGKALADAERVKLESALSGSKVLQTIYAMRLELTGLWERSNDSREQLLHRLQDWCRRAEASGIPPLARFSQDLRQFA
ncbi:MAG: fatty acid desaturase [Betaproteobacteria bacterium]